MRNSQIIFFAVTYFALFISLQQLTPSLWFARVCVRAEHANNEATAPKLRPLIITLKKKPPCLRRKKPTAVNHMQNTKYRAVMARAEIRNHGSKS